MPQATRSDDHRTYRCYLRGPDGIRELSPYGPGALPKLPEPSGEVNAPGVCKPEPPLRRLRRAGGPEVSHADMESPGLRRLLESMTSFRAPPPHRLGALGEDAAASYLRGEGWTVVDRNVRWGRKEIDLVARRGRLLAFVEVKTRSGGGYGAPQEAVTWKKRREIESVARFYLARQGAADLDVRFDVVAVRTDREGRIVHLNHLEDAWRPGL